MGLVIKIKGAKAEENAKQIYRDALVTKGSLLLHDYSNKGCTIDFDITDGVLDLSREASRIDGVENGTKFEFKSGATKPELTDGKGFKMNWLGRNATYPNADNGIQLGSSLTSYLVANKPNLLVICWVRFDTSVSTASGRFLDPEDSVDGGTGKLIALGHGATGLFSPHLLGIQVGGESNVGNILQFSMEVTAEGVPIKVYTNGQFIKNSASNNFGYGSTAVELNLGNNLSGAPINLSSVLYRLVIEDLGVSGRTAEEVVKKDWDYCNGIGEFEGTNSKRPFITEI